MRSVLKLTASAAILLVGLSACDTPTGRLVVVPPEARPDAASLSECADTQILLDRRANYETALMDFLDAVRASGCGYQSFRVDVNDRSIATGYNDRFARSQAIDVIRGYERSNGESWMLHPNERDPDIPRFHMRVTFMEAAAG